MSWALSGIASTPVRAPAINHALNFFMLILLDGMALPRLCDIHNVSYVSERFAVGATVSVRPAVAGPGLDHHGTPAARPAGRRGATASPQIPYPAVRVVPQ